MIALYPPAEVALVLAVDGGVHSRELHLTLADCGLARDIDWRPLLEAAATVTGRAPVCAVVSGTTRFTLGTNHGCGDVFCALMDGLAVQELRHRLLEALQRHTVPVRDDHVFVPHITLARLGERDPAPVQRLPPRTVTFKTISVVHGHNRIDLPFHGRSSATAAIRSKSGRAHPSLSADSRALTHLRTRQLPAVADGVSPPPLPDTQAVTAPTNTLINRVLGRPHRTPPAGTSNTASALTRAPTVNRYRPCPNR